MTGACVICKQLVIGAAVPEAAEFAALSEAMREHLYQRHQNAVQVFAWAVQGLVFYFSSLFLTAAAPEFEREQTALRQSVVGFIEAARVSVVLGADQAPAGPAAGGGPGALAAN